MVQDLIIFEASFEVVNKVGGIHTVLSSKAPSMKKEFRDYFAIGPYYERKAATDFEDEKPSPEFQLVFNELEKEFGIKCYSGHWLVDGRPKCILVDPGAMKEKTNEIKEEYWNYHGIDSLNSPPDFTEPLIWAKAAGIVLQALINEVFSKEHNKEQCVVHCHEWLSGGTLLHLKQADPEIKTVFTTHATVLGRSIAEAGLDLHGEVNRALNEKKCVEESRCYDFNVQAKHQTEKISAHKADVFSTVSETTAKEAEFILGRKPDAVLPNGLNMGKFYLMEELANLHVKYRNTIRKFVMDYFSPYYYLDVDNTLFYFLSGRYEFRNKGLDLFIDSLGDLNKRLREEDTAKTVVAFIWVPSGNKGKNIELMKHLALYERLEDEIEDEVKKIKNRLYNMVSKGESPTHAGLLDDEFLYNTKKMIFELKHEKHDVPPVSALEMDSDNSITRTIKKNKLLNKESDRVKVIYYPSYLSSTDGLIGLDYYQAITGCHLGVFPSYYEPWGYTPLETMALGLSAVTTDTAGFGLYAEKHVLKEKEPQNALKVIKRANKPYHESKDELTEFMYSMLHLGKRQRGEAKILAKRTSYLFGWNELIKEYGNAYGKLFEHKK